MLAFEARLGHRCEGKLASKGLMAEWFLVRCRQEATDYADEAPRARRQW
jgi:hypothetical protein